MNQEVKYDVTKNSSKLLVVIVNRGFAHDVVETTRPQGATGATILSGRGSAGIGETFMGMSITPEKEVVLIVITSELAEKTMKAIASSFGLTSRAQGICFMLPVEQITKKMSS